MSRLERLTELALKMHEGQVDKQGRPYSAHILAVTEAVSEEAKPVALFHDAIEDGRARAQEIASILLPVEAEAVWLLTRGITTTYAGYTEVLRSLTGYAADLAREVKIADLRHNLGRLTPELESLRPRYGQALRTLGAA